MKLKKFKHKDRYGESQLTLSLNSREIRHIYSAICVGLPLIENVSNDDTEIQELSKLKGEFLALDELSNKGVVDEFDLTMMCVHGGVSLKYFKECYDFVNENKTKDLKELIDFANDYD